MPKRKLPNMQAGPQDGAQRAVLSLRMLDQDIRIAMGAGTEAIEHAVRLNYAGLPTAHGIGFDLSYALTREGGAEDYVLWRDGDRALVATGTVEMLRQLQAEVTVDVQRRTPDMLHMRAAALELQGHAWLLAGGPEGGKTTVAWELLHHGFRFISDGFSAVDLKTLQVHARAEALCLQHRPSGAYRRPPGGALDLGHAQLIPATALPAVAAGATVPLAGVVFLQHEPMLREPVLQSLHAAEASAWLYVNTLNALAHPSCGVDAVVAAVQGVPCWLMFTADLGSTARSLKKLAITHAPA
jgi:hypothetical protein